MVAALGVTAQATTVANFDFDNYLEDSTGEGSPGTGTTVDRLYLHNTGPLATGVTSVSAISWNVLVDNSSQNMIDLHDTDNTGTDNSMAYRAALGAGTITASFDVTLTDGYELTNWDVSFGHEFNRNGVTYAITAGGIDGGSGSAPDIDAWAFDGGGTVVATALTGTFNVQIAFTNTNTSGSVRFDDIQLNGTVLGGPANGAPTFTSDPINATNATEDVAYSNTIADEASDPDSDPLTFSKVSGPAWLNVSTNGVLSGTPAFKDVGANVFTVKVDDGNGGTDSATLNITVIAAARIVGGVTWLGNDLLKLEVSGASPAASYCPASTTNLVNGAWGRIPHSDDGVNDFIVTNLTYSTTDGTNRFIYMQQGTNRIGFIRIQRSN